MGLTTFPRPIMSPLGTDPSAKWAKTTRPRRWSWMVGKAAKPRASLLTMKTGRAPPVEGSSGETLTPVEGTPVRLGPRVLTLKGPSGVPKSSTSCRPKVCQMNRRCGTSFPSQKKKSPTGPQRKILRPALHMSAQSPSYRRLAVIPVSLTLVKNTTHQTHGPLSRRRKLTPPFPSPCMRESHVIRPHHLLIPAKPMFVLPP